jgi:hypothetical protein
MGFVIDALSFIVFPGLAFSLLFGVLSVWFAAWLTRVLRRENPGSWKESVLDTAALFRLAMQPVELRPRWTVMVPLLGLGAAAAASMYLWRSALDPATTHLGTLPLFLALLFVSVLVAIYMSDWHARSKGVSSARDSLVLANCVVFFFAMATPAVAVGSLEIGGIVGSQIGAWPLLTTYSGALAGLVGLLTARALLTLVGTLLDEGLKALGGAAELLTIQLVRAVFTFVLLSGLVIIFWSDWGYLPFGLLLFIPKYVLALLLVVAMGEAMRRWHLERLLSYAWLPLGLASLIALGLAVGGL